MALMELQPMQFAQYSSLKNPDESDWQNPTLPLPASMERHGHGSYQPTLPGMEKMLPGEQSHVSTLFKHPNVSDPEIGEPRNSRWYSLTTNYHPKKVNSHSSSLRPSQDWLDDNYLHSPIDNGTLADQGTRPKVESIGGKNVIQDGHHRAAREILSGSKRVAIDQWGGQ